ncbi:hypothetical protein CCMA1212_006454 [Trichoderma ghanense]|uniref:Heterokaryon incompatibility domain-containing protein n=1 Tax=Trichoderma ghanense TaxID=65468 RepID=A0ABY2H0I5_9HYPO
MDQLPEDGEPVFRKTLYPSKDDLCDACRRISIPALTAELASPPSFWREMELEDIMPITSKYGMRLSENALDFTKRAKTCAMCWLIANAFAMQYQTLQGIAERPIFLSPWWTYGTATPMSSNPVEDQVPLMGMLIWMPVDEHPHATPRDGYVPCTLRFYTDDESPHTFQRIVGRVPVPSTGSPQALARLRHQLSTCRENHTKCRQTVAGPPFKKEEEPIRPTRVIDLGSTNSSEQDHRPVRLLSTDGSRGHYVVFSYRSAVLENPFCTTRANLEDHLQSIPWTKFPKTLQQAMEMTKSLGFRYFWIDLLCVVQDDPEERLHESTRLGNVIEGAALVIADSSGWSLDEGLFNTPSNYTSSTLTRIPYHDADGIADGTALYVDCVDHNIMSDPDETDSTFSGRAWVTQEFFMARRIAFFTHSGTVWSCRTVRIGPNGVQDNPTRNLENRKWFDIIQHHVLTELKHPEDRLQSLESIRTAIRKRDGGTPYRHGMFEKELQTQLMWRVVKGRARKAENPAAVPSWSWASSMAEIQFFEYPADPAPLSIIIQWESCGNMSFKGDAISVPAAKLRKLKKSSWWQKMKVVPEPMAEPDDANWENTLRFDEIEPPGKFAGALFGLLLCTKEMKWPADRLSLNEYFIVLRRISKWNQTYERVGAGMSCSHGRLMDNLSTWSSECKVRSIRIV